LIVTAVPFVLLWVAAWACLRWSYKLSLAVAVPAAGFLVRLFMVQHDCGHGAFDWTGRIIGVLTLTPGAAMRCITPARATSIDVASAT
jgi:omega-6 fatty acid desaturase (delta-12 desaturase)